MEIKVIPMLKKVKWIFSSLFVFSTVYLFWLFTLQNMLPGLRGLAVALALAVVLILSKYLLVKIGWVQSKVPSIKPQIWIPLLVVSLILGVWISTLTYQNLPENPYLLPISTLEIIAEAEGNPGNTGNNIGIYWFATSAGDVSFSQFHQQGEWEFSEDGLTTTGNEKASLKWNGRTGEYAKLVFLKNPDAGNVTIVWNGAAESHSLYAPKPGELVIEHEFTGSPMHDLLNWVTLWIFTASAVLVALIIFEFLLQKPFQAARIFLTHGVENIPGGNLGNSDNRQFLKLIDKKNRKYFLTIFCIFILFGLGIFARSDLSHVSNDMRIYNLRWYNYFDKGILVALGENFTNYTPPYTYLLALVYTTLPFLPKVAAIKTISIIFDFINCFLVYRIVRLKYPKGATPFWAAGVFIILPTVFINSAYWGQVDAIYTSLLLTSLYFFLTEKPIWGILAFSFSFAFKLQAIFFFPFLVVLFFKKQIKVWHLFLIPIIYIMMSLPTVLLGRDWVDVLTIYINQTETYNWLSGSAPNLYIFISNKYYQLAVVIGFVITFICISTWITLTVLRNKSINRDRLIYIALISVALLPFLLPKMHERYFYPADVFSLLVAFFFPEIWFVPIVYQIISGLSYTVFLWGAPITNVYIGTGLNVIILTFLIGMQFRYINTSPDK